jgi:protein KRI1
LNEKIDKEDEERDLEMDVYEEKHNFRFEQKNADSLITHSRDKPEDSMRKPDDRRKDQRENAKIKKEEEKIKRKEEINKLKAWKREEIIEKLKKTEFIAGNFGHKNKSDLGVKGGILSDKKLLERAERELNTEFIPDLYDQTMAKLFNQ